MNYKYLFLLFAIFISTIVSSQETGLDLYLLIGQSNMAGRGKIEHQDTISFPGVYTFDKNNNWVAAKDPIHFDKSVAGVGLGRTFGIEIAKKHPGKKIGLIPCAVGGSPIDSWNPGEFYKPTGTYPWDDMQKRLQLALNDGKLKGIVWHQGESDSKINKCYNYEKKLKSLIKRVRELAGDESIPFVAGEMLRLYMKNNAQKNPGMKPHPAKVVSNATKKVVKADKNCGFVKSKGLTHKGDQVHFNAKSYRFLGKRYARAMVKLQND